MTFGIGTEAGMGTEGTPDILFTTASGNRMAADAFEHRGDDPYGRLLEEMSEVGLLGAEAHLDIDFGPDSKYLRTAQRNRLI